LKKKYIMLTKKRETAREREAFLKFT